MISDGILVTRPNSKTIAISKSRSAYWGKALFSAVFLLLWYTIFYDAILEFFETSGMLKDLKDEGQFWRFVDWFLYLFPLGMVSSIWASLRGLLEVKEYIFNGENMCLKIDDTRIAGFTQIENVRTSWQLPFGGFKLKVNFKNRKPIYIDAGRSQKELLELELDINYIIKMNK